MPEPSTGRAASAKHPKSLIERLTAFIFREPENRQELLTVLADAHERQLLDADALSMIEGVLQVSELRARDLMVPSTQMDVIDLGEPIESWIGRVVASGHSRFPVIEGDRDQVIGILLAKDLLRHYAAHGFDVRAKLRPAAFIPESKPLNVLLRDFRANRNHLAMVVDEFGNTAGLITIEDVLEEIVGEIEDEFDEQDAHSGIVTLADGTHRVAGDADVSAVNEAFGVRLPEEEFDTIGGLVADQLGRVPRRGEAVQVQGLSFSVMLTRGGAVRWFKVARVNAPAEGTGTAEAGGPPAAPLA